MTFLLPLRRGIASAALAALLAVAAGCASGPEPAMPSGPQTGAVDTGTYPNLNVPPEAAAAPISDEDKTGLTGRLAGAKARQAAAGRGAGAKSDPAYLERLARDHGEDTLKAIAAE